MWPALAKFSTPRERVLVGDDEFDQAFLLRGQPEKVVTTVFAPAELRQRVLELRPVTGLMLRGKEIWLAEAGLERDVDYLHFVFDLLCDLAEQVEKAVVGNGTS
jgi:hypothetical protein